MSAKDSTAATSTSYLEIFQVLAGAIDSIVRFMIKIGVPNERWGELCSDSQVAEDVAWAFCGMPVLRPISGPVPDSTMYMLEGKKYKVALPDGQEIRISQRASIKCRSEVFSCRVVGFEWEADKEGRFIRVVVSDRQHPPVLDGEPLVKVSDLLFDR